MPLTAPLSSTPLPHDPINLAATHNASLARQVSSTRSGDGHSALNNKSLFRPHLLVTLSPQVTESSRLATYSEDYDPRSSSLPKDINISDASGEIQHKIGGTDSRDLLHVEQSYRSEAKFSNQASTTGKVKSNLNFKKRSRKLFPDNGNNDFKISQAITIKANSPNSGRAKSITQEELTNQTITNMERKTRRSLPSTTQKTQVNYISLRAEMSSVVAQEQNQRGTKKQNGNQSTLRDARKIKIQGDSIERITHPNTLPSSPEMEDQTLTDIRSHQREVSPERGVWRASISTLIGRNVKMLVSEANQRGGSRSLSERSEQFLSSSQDLKDSEEQLDEEGKYRAVKWEEKRDKSFESPAEGRVMEDGEEKPSEGVEKKLQRQHEKPSDTSFHALHVSPFIPDLTLSDDDSPANPSPNHQSVSLPGIDLFPITSDDNPSTSDDTRAPQSFTGQTKLQGVNQHSDKGDKGRTRLTEADSSRITYMEVDQPLPVRPSNEDELSDIVHLIQNETALKLYDTHTKKTNKENDQLSLLLPSPEEDRAGTGRKVQQGSTTKRRGTSPAPDIPLPDTEGSVRIPCYVIIFLLGIIGNTLVIVTLLQNRKMRTITNVFLLNLVSEKLGDE